MKDYKPKVINVTNNIRATIYPNGDFDISFLYDISVIVLFAFSKLASVCASLAFNSKISESSLGGATSTFLPLNFYKNVRKHFVNI